MVRRAPFTGAWEDLPRGDVDAKQRNALMDYSVSVGLSGNAWLAVHDRVSSGVSQP